MRIVLLPLLLCATPVAAQIWDGGRSAERRVPRQFDSDTATPSREIGRIDRSIRQGARRGELTRQEARDLRAQAAALATAAHAASAGIGPQQTGAVLGLRGLVDARRAAGRERKAGR